MANKNDIFNILNKPVNNPNFNGFDLGQFSPFSLKLGQVKPIGYVHTVPKGHYRLSVDELCHTEPFITDPFVRLSKHIEFVFVPYSQLWHGSTQFFGHADDPQSSYEHGHSYCPNFSLGHMLDIIYKSYSDPGANGWYDIQGLNIAESALSLLSQLGYGCHPLFQMTDGEREFYIESLQNERKNAWALLAYNKYWNVYLRDTQHTTPLNPIEFNADICPCTSVETSQMENYYSDTQLLELVTIKYRKVKKDIFTSSLVSRQFGTVEGVTFTFGGAGTVYGNGSQIGNTFPTATTYTTNLDKDGDFTIQNGRNVGYFEKVDDGSVKLVDSDGNAFKHAHNSARLTVVSNSGSIPGLLTNYSGTGSFDVYTLLTAQMMQKWREQIQRAGNRADDRLRALYGTSPKSDAMNSPYIIGSTSYDIRANQVTQTVGLDESPLGSIAAKGIGYSERNEFEFTASEFGIILVCTYILPENAYMAPMDRMNDKIEPFDYYVQQTENLGLEGIQRKYKETCVYDPLTGHYSTISAQQRNSIIGYAARNWDYKQKVNVVHYGFQHGVENSKWMPSRPFYDAAGGTAIGAANQYYVQPNEYDTVFGTITDYHIDTDQFIGACNVKIDSVLPMSELGIPRW